VALLSALGVCALTSALTLPAAAAAISPGDVFAASGNGRVRQFTPTGTFIQTLDTTTVGTYMTGMCFDPSLNFFATNLSAGDLSKMNSSGTLVNATFASGLASPESCVRDATGNFYISQVGGAGVRKVDATGAPLGTSSMGRTDWIDLAADQCTLLYTTEGSTIGRWNVCTTPR
jgi:sugar lactone lactonase YvrE